MAKALYRECPGISKFDIPGHSLDYLIKFLTGFHDETFRSQLDSKGLLKLVEDGIDKG